MLYLKFFHWFVEYTKKNVWHFSKKNWPSFFSFSKVPVLRLASVIKSLDPWEGLTGWLPLVDKFATFQTSGGSATLAFNTSLPTTGSRDYGWYSGVWMSTNQRFWVDLSVPRTFSKMRDDNGFFIDDPLSVSIVNFHHFGGEGGHTRVPNCNG